MFGCRNETRGRKLDKKVRYEIIGPSVAFKYWPLDILTKKLMAKMYYLLPESELKGFLPTSPRIK